MNCCPVSRQIDDYIHGEMVVDALHERLNSRIAELMAVGGEYYPFDINNHDEALGELDEARKLIRKHYFENEFYQVAAELESIWVTEYWQKKAEGKAVEELS